LRAEEEEEAPEVEQSRTCGLLSHLHSRVVKRKNSKTKMGRHVPLILTATNTVLHNKTQITAANKEEHCM